MFIDAPDFALGNELRVLGLQGDWLVRAEPGPQGGKFVIENATRAHNACIHFLALVAASAVELALVPELAIPKHTVQAIIDAMRGIPRSIVFLGGIEGLSREDYLSLLDGIGESQALADEAVGDYVNCLLIVVRTPTFFRAYLRAKRVASGPENQGSPLTVGRGPFVILRLGPHPVTVLPLICAEFVWPNELWTKLQQEVPCVIDYIPVLQRNDDILARHTSPQLHTAYTQGNPTGRSRFIFVNQAVGCQADGTCYVVVPPNSPNPPPFDHALNELWHLPSISTYKGFRIPDITGCIWWATITNPQAGGNALGNRLCAGKVSEVLTPAGTALSGLAAGLMRTAVDRYRHDVVSATSTPVRASVLDALDESSARYILRAVTREVANDVFYRMRRVEAPLWNTVETIVHELVEAASLLATGGDNVALAACEADNCCFSSKPIAILFAPNVDAALAARFPTADLLDGSPIPVAVVLIGVVAGTTSVNTHKVGDVLRADRVTSASKALEDAPSKTDDTSATIRADDVEFHYLQELRPNLALPGIANARDRIGKLYARAYA